MTPEITAALRALYGVDPYSFPPLLDSLQPDCLKTAFRKRALELHPDRATVYGRSTEEMGEAFMEVKSAYLLILNHLGTSLDISSHADIDGTRLPDQPASARTDDVYWEGGIPATRLLFGQFLHYAGLITRKSLLLAILWQRRSRPSFGRIARMWGYISDADIRDILTRMENSERIGETAFRKGFLTGFQCDTVLGFQRYLQRPIGEYFRETGILREDEIDYLVGLMKEHNKRV
jgi:hypothetical protein